MNKWDENDSENFADGDDAHILLKWGVNINAMRGERFQKCNVTTVQLSTKK